MPEILEVEAARAVIEAHALDRVVETVHAPDAWFLKRGLTPAALKAALPGHRFVAARRRGKLLLIDTDAAGPTLGMHLGMSGRVIVDEPKRSVRRRGISAGSAAGPERPGAEGAESGRIEAGDPLIYGRTATSPSGAGSACRSATAGRCGCATRGGSAPSSWTRTRSGSGPTRSRSHARSSTSGSTARARR
jgi:formamidopyrimidine-DNA glycosylase